MSYNLVPYIRISIQLYTLSGPVQKLDNEIPTVSV